MSYRLKRIIIVAIGCLCGLMQISCKIENIDTEKLADLEYVIVEEENIPEEVYELVVGDMEEFNRTAYVCSDVLYIVICYGAQPTEGYTIEVNSLYESSNAVFVETTLIGPSARDDVEQVISYPYIVLQVENKDKTVVFN